MLIYTLNEASRNIMASMIKLMLLKSIIKISLVQYWVAQVVEGSFNNQ